MKKVIVMIYLSMLISSCNGEERKENKKETKKEVQIEKVEKKSETKKEDNNTKVTYIEIKPIPYEKIFNVSEDDINQEIDDIYYNARIKYLSNIDKRIASIKNGICYMVVEDKKLVCGRIKNGKREGTWEFWSPNGGKVAEIEYKDGKIDGRCHVNMINSWDITYKDGKKDGRWSVWGEDTAENGLYEAGERIGEWEYSDWGYTKTNIYINGEIVESDILFSDKENKNPIIRKYRNNRLESMEKRFNDDENKEIGRYINGEVLEKSEDKGELGEGLEFDESGNIKLIEEEEE